MSSERTLWRDETTGSKVLPPFSRASRSRRRARALLCVRASLINSRAFIPRARVAQVVNGHIRTAIPWHDIAPKPQRSLLERDRLSAKSRRVELINFHASKKEKEKRSDRVNSFLCALVCATLFPRLSQERLWNRPISTNDRLFVSALEVNMCRHIFILLAQCRSQNSTSNDWRARERLELCFIGKFYMKKSKTLIRRSSLGGNLLVFDIECVW